MGPDRGAGRAGEGKDVPGKAPNSDKLVKTNVEGTIDAH